MKKKTKMGYAGGGKMKTKGYAGGGKKKTKGYAGGGKIRMSPKMMANGGPTGAVKRDNAKSSVARGSGAARPQPFRKNG